MLAIASQNLESSMLKEECGEATEKDRKEREQLEQEIENLEIYIEKYSIEFCHHKDWFELIFLRYSSIRLHRL